MSRKTKSKAEVELSLETKEINSIVEYIKKQVENSDEIVNRVVKVLLLDVLDDKYLEKVLGKEFLTEIREWGKPYFRDQLVRFKAMVDSDGEEKRKKFIRVLAWEIIDNYFPNK